MVLENPPLDTGSSEKYPYVRGYPRKMVPGFPENRAFDSNRSTPLGMPGEELQVRFVTAFQGCPGRSPYARANFAMAGQPCALGQRQWQFPTVCRHEYSTCRAVGSWGSDLASIRIRLSPVAQFAFQHYDVQGRDNVVRANDTFRGR